MGKKLSLEEYLEIEKRHIDCAFDIITQSQCKYLTMGYTTGTYSGSDQQSVVNGLSSKYNYVYFPDSHSLYLVGEYYPVYIRKITMFKDFYFGTLNHK